MWTGGREEAEEGVEWVKRERGEEVKAERGTMEEEETGERGENGIKWQIKQSREGRWDWIYQCPSSTTITYDITDFRITVIDLSKSPEQSLNGGC